MNMHHEIIMAGTGGQGIMVIGQLLAHAAVIEDKNVVWFPSYGPESRGGAANCTVIVANGEIGSPVTATPEILIAASQMALDKFVKAVRPGGMMLINSSLVTLPEDRTDCRIVPIPASEVADELGNYRIANMVMLGAFIELLKPVKLESVCEALTDVLPPHRHKLIPLNESALKRGVELAKQL